MTDVDFAIQCHEGKISVHKLEEILDDPERAVRVRKKWLEMQINSTLPRLPSGSLFDAKGFYSDVKGACAENVVGYVPIPVGIAGPLLLNGKLHHLPMATVEGTLVASTSRGCRSIHESGGASSTVLGHGMTRAPVVQFPSACRAAVFKRWLEQNFEEAKTAFDATTRHGELSSIKVTVAGTYAYARFCCSTGDAMGMNMVSKGVEAVLSNLQKHFQDMHVLGLSGNMCADKKPASINWIEGRGYSVVVEATLSEESVRTVLKTSAEAMVNLNIAKNLVGSAMAGTSAGGFNAHAANIVTAIFIACGQDPAQVVESANCITLMHSTPGGGVHVSCTMPSIEVGTVGGGTHLAAQRSCIDAVGAHVHGFAGKDLAQVVAGAVLAAEVSLIAALSSGQLVGAHMRLNRK